MKERSLGRGLSDLLSENDLNFSTEEIIKDIRLLDIKPNPDQPRIVFEEGSLKDLAESIKEHGVIQPIIVKPSTEGYILVAGERRLKACELAGLETVPTIVREYNSLYLAELALLENLQREDLTAVEEAIAIYKLQSKLQLTHEELGKKIGKSRTYITNLLGLLRLPNEILNDVNNGIISAGHARALSKLKLESDMILYRNKVVDEELSVRELETLLRNTTSKHNVEVSKKTLLESKEKINRIFDNRFKVKVTKNSVSFKFKSEQELMDIITTLREMSE